ncbi:MAG: tRNA (guanine(46)-N(7))-methyltransferase TrmB [Phycisphaeraceae bacterium]
MASSLGHGRELDTTGYGWTWDDLPAPDAGPLDLRTFFAFPQPDADPPRPLELEIGSGKGTFGVSYGEANPGVDLLGIEYARAFWRYAADRVRRHAMPNVRMLYAEASSFLKLYVPEASLRQVHIYFPDPWPKKRHHKRRFVCEANLRLLHRLLEAGADGSGGTGQTSDSPPGQVRIATDHADYFTWMEEAATACADVFERRDFDPPGSGEAGELVGTNFERKYRRAGRSFYGMILVRKESHRDSF